jgi:C-terminal processing protease CtpA/Prc
VDSLPDDSLLYVNFNSVRDDPAETLAQFSERLGNKLATGRFTSAMIDLRLNNGGNNTLLPPLEHAITSFVEASSRHRVVVLIGRATFSAGQNFANWLDRYTSAVFVGEPTGSRPNFLGDGSDTPLPYSGLRVSIAGRRYDDSTPDDARAWIAPDVPVPVLSTDYFANRDPAFDAALATIRGVRGTAAERAHVQQVRSRHDNYTSPAGLVR